MMKAEHYYAYDVRPGVGIRPEERITRCCAACGDPFVTGCRTKRRCDRCQERVRRARSVVYRKRSNARKRGRAA